MPLLPEAELRLKLTEAFGKIPELRSALGDGVRAVVDELGLLPPDPTEEELAIKVWHRCGIGAS